MDTISQDLSVLDPWGLTALDEPAAPVTEPEPEAAPAVEPKPYWMTQTDHAATALTVAAMATGGIGMGVGVVGLDPINTVASAGLAYVGYRALAYLRRNR